jgi:hypothetical protein
MGRVFYSGKFDGELFCDFLCFRISYSYINGVGENVVGIFFGELNSLKKFYP